MTWFVVFSVSSIFDGFFTKIHADTRKKATEIISKEFGRDWYEKIYSIMDEYEFAHAKTRRLEIKNKYGGSFIDNDNSNWR